MNQSFKAAVQHIHAQKLKETAWIYAAAVGEKKNNTQDISSPPVLDTTNPEKLNF